MFKYESIVNNEIVTFYDEHVINLENYAKEMINIDGDVNFITEITDAETGFVINHYRFIKSSKWARALDLDGIQKPVCMKIEF